MHELRSPKDEKSLKTKGKVETKPGVRLARAKGKCLGEIKANNTVKELLLCSVQFFDTPRAFPGAWPSRGLFHGILTMTAIGINIPISR